MYHFEQKSCGKRIGEKEIYEKGVSRDWKAVTAYNKKKPKQIDQIKAFSLYFPYRTFVRAKGGRLSFLHTFSDWVKGDNQCYRCDLWTAGEDGLLYTSNLVIEGGMNQKFLVDPSFHVKVGRKVQYYWHFKNPVSELEKGRLNQTAEMLAYSAYGSRSLLGKEIGQCIVPGIPDLKTGKIAELMHEDGSAKSFTLSELWKAVSKHYPVKGKSLDKYLHSNKTYRKGLTTLREFLGIRRLNKLKGIKFSHKEFRQGKGTILFLFWVFSLDTGYSRDEAMALLYEYLDRNGFEASDQDILSAVPVKHYRYRQETLIQTLQSFTSKRKAEQIRRLFTSRKNLKREKKRKAAAEKKKRLLELVGRLFRKGLSCQKVADQLKVSLSTAKRFKKRLCQDNPTSMSSTILA